ncbi:MAG: hypothetical protein AB8H80_06995 [Planctomycetota bacterium]
MSTARAFCLLAVTVATTALSSCTPWSKLSPSAALARTPAEQDARQRIDALLVAYRAELAELPKADESTSVASKAQADEVVAALRDACTRHRQRLADGRPPYAVLESFKNARNQLLATPASAGLKAWNNMLTAPEDLAWQPSAALLRQLSQPILDGRADLFARKYFHDPKDEGGNLVEGYLNSRFDLFRSAQLGEHGGADDSSPYGVSPWEAIARLEPFASVDGSSDVGLLGAVGITRHLFPNGQGEDLWSRYLQRVGLRLGAGATMGSGEAGDFVLGVGVQLRSWTVWTLWNAEDEDVIVGIGSGDFRWLGELTTWFGGA